jgi:hypothetical protein
MPLVPGAPITGIDMIADGHYAEVFDLAAEHTTAEDALDQYQPGWRALYRSDFEVFEAADGELGIRFSTRDGSAEMSPADLSFEAGEAEHGAKE